MAENIIGKPARIAKNEVPTRVSLFKTVFMYVVVSFPGLIPGI